MHRSYFRNNERIMLRMMLSKIDVAKGKYNVNFSLSMYISPGSLPKKGMFAPREKIIPRRTKVTPKNIRMFPK